MARATITEIKAAGAVVLLNNREKAWLPGQELSAKYVPSKKLFEQGLCTIGQELDVVVYGKEFGGKHKLVSHIRFTNDPWDKIKTWKYGDVKEMVIHSVTPGRAYGKIEAGIEGFVELPDIYNMTPFPRSWRDFKTISVGDVIAGSVNPVKIDSQNRLVKLNVTAYFKNLEKISGFLPTRDKNSLQTAEPPKTENPNQKEWHVVSSLEIRRTLVVDDSSLFLEEMGGYLEICGIKVEKFSTKAEAIEFIASSRCPDLDAAILDVNLERSSDYLGFQVAKVLAAHQPRCRIIMTTGDDVEREKVNKIAGDLSVSSFLFKPFGIEELNKAFSNATAGKTEKLQSFFDFLKEKRETILPAAGSSRSLSSAACELKEEIYAEIVAIFSIHPLTYDVNVEAYCGVSRGRVNDYIPKLRFSPVKDVAIDKEIIFEGKINNTPKYPKHRWLYKALNYESCLGFPVNIAHEREYCLFAFHGNENHFSDLDRYRVKTTADRIAQLLEIQRLEETIRNENPFYLAGKTYGSMAHDLFNALNREFGLLHIFKLIEDKTVINTNDIQELKKQLENLRRELKRAEGIVETFRRMSRSQYEQETDVDVFKTVNRVAKTIKIEAEALHTTIIVPPVPPTDGGHIIPTKVKIKETSLEQILYNLFLNAAQQIKRFSFIREKGYILVEFATFKQEDKYWLQVLIHDSGPGIHARDFEKVFQKGYTTKEGGCGMGLDICRNLLNQVGGRIKVLKSILFCGTTFEILLPINDQEV
jgi:signal transduction histidine kinase/DNA-binding NarL/FixJ family response regulator